MAPYAGVTTTITRMENRKHIKEDVPKDVKLVPKGYKGFFGEYVTDLIWLHIISIGLFHVIALYCFITFPFLSCNYKTLLWGVVMGGFSGFGVTAGAHRLWCHRSYKAKLPLQIILAICYSAAGQNTIFDWVRDHRVHHKYSETDADPHNSNRGFFFAHMGWLFMRKHPEVIRRGNQIDMSDITDDPLLKLHHKFFLPLKIIFCFVLPTAVPVYFWSENIYNAIVTQCIVRYILSLHFTWSVNSAAHLFGNKPYNININPRENLAVALISMGEGWHNYHHTFPWDYRAAELGKINTTLIWLDLFQKIGWAYDMKTPSKELIKAVIERRGPESVNKHCHSHPEEVPTPDSDNEKSI
ncbi:PREDICTED: acyl-CoA Delta(11) desaturase [Nicrophorus vespilloides]|uniref:Acyl-CoA Delta(11) desaturase n=1 Tax=Nicrophorus vespilloides TaxID=110193 RepID=A0ABM1MPJ3_NICVS|nr:PREDICTED: acyl-CoA Delta(11) desaturase [Nicrophorus vespilloides]